MWSSDLASSTKILDLFLSLLFSSLSPFDELHYTTTLLLRFFLLMLGSSACCV